MKDTRKELIELGERYLLLNGLDGFSFHDLARDVGIKSAGVHYHFPTKNDLSIALIQHHSQILKQLIDKNKEQKEEDMLRGLLDLYSDLQNDQYTCIQIAFLHEWNDLGIEVQKELKKYNKELINYLTEILQAGLSKGQFTFRETARTQALMIMSNLTSALLFARMLGKEDFWTLRNAILRSVRS